MEKVYRSSQVIFIALLFLVSCSTKKVMEEDNARFKDINDEYSQVVKVDALPHKPPKKGQPTSAEKTVPQPVVKQQMKQPSVQTEIRSVEEKLQKVKEMTQIKKISREPKIEDSEGFVSRRPLVDPFRENERITMAASYLGNEAGEISVRVNPIKSVNQRQAYHFSVHIKTSKVFSMFYAVDNMAETFVDYETLLPVTYTMNAKESSRVKEVRTFFDHAKNEATHWEKTIRKKEDEKKKKVIWEIEPYSQNNLSAIYYLRNFQLTPGKTFAFRIADGGKNINIKIEVLRKERLKTEIGDLNTVVVKPTFEVEGEFKATGDNLIWLTDDERKYIVRIESKVKIGTIVAKVRKIEPGN